jgi:hypothetical protein
MSVSARGARPDRAAGAAAVLRLPLGPVLRAIFASLPLADLVAVLVDGGLADGLRWPECLPLVAHSNRSFKLQIGGVFGGLLCVQARSALAGGQRDWSL